MDAVIVCTTVCPIKLLAYLSGSLPCTSARRHRQRRNRHAKNFISPFAWDCLGGGLSHLATSSYIDVELDSEAKDRIERVANIPELKDFGMEDHKGVK